MVCLSTGGGHCSAIVGADIGSSVSDRYVRGDREREASRQAGKEPGRRAERQPVAAWERSLTCV